MTLTLPTEIADLLNAFAPVLTRPTFKHATTLIVGAILATGRRTVTTALRAVGLGQEHRFTTYHRVLNRARWSPFAASKILLELLLEAFVKPDEPLVLLIDTTLERRSGKRNAIKGRFHDGVRSQRGHTITSEGVHWLCVALLLKLPWSSRRWALPFLSVPTLSPATSLKLGKQHRRVPQTAAILVRLVRRWQPNREIVLVGDSGFAAVALGQACVRSKVRLVSRLILNAQLYEEFDPINKKRGPKAYKGARQPKLSARLVDPATVWTDALVDWYSEPIMVQLATGLSLWHTDGEKPLAVRWVLIRHPNPRCKPMALFCTDQTASAEQILSLYLDRWAIEVSFEEVRAHLGFETQRQWSGTAVGRTSPCLLGLLSLVVLMAQQLHPHTLPIRQSAWYVKLEPTFSDVLAAVRRWLWASRNSPGRVTRLEAAYFPSSVLEALVGIACYAA